MLSFFCANGKSLTRFQPGCYRASERFPQERLQRKQDYAAAARRDKITLILLTVNSRTLIWVLRNLNL